MDTFYKLNKEKIRFGFVVSSLILIGFVLFVLAIAYFTNNMPHKELLFVIFLAASIGFPILIIMLPYILCLYMQKIRKKLFSVEPFNQLQSIGFVDTFTNIHTKWHFTEKVKTALMDGYTLIVDISVGSNNAFIFEIPVEWKMLDKASFNELTDKFKKHNINFGIECLKKRYQINKQTFLNIDELKLDLEKFVELIKEEGFEPKKGCAKH
jgi:hypothetical protein